MKCTLQSYQFSLSRVVGISHHNDYHYCTLFLEIGMPVKRKTTDVALKNVIDFSAALRRSSSTRKIGEVNLGTRACCSRPRSEADRAGIRGQATRPTTHTYTHNTHTLTHTHTHTRSCRRSFCEADLPTDREFKRA